MCNHCHSHEAVEKFKTDSRKAFLSSLSETSSQISEIEVGILAKDVKDSVGVITFGSIPDILGMLNMVYMSVLKASLEKAKSENDIQMAFMLFNQIVNITDEIKDFMTELDKITDEIKASINEG